MNDRTLSIPTLLPALLGPLALLLAGAGCTGTKKTPPSVQPPANASQLLFVRDNAQGGSDLYVAAIDGKSPPRRLTDHVLGERVVLDAVGGEDFAQVYHRRVVVQVRRADVDNFVAIDVSGERDPVALTSFTGNTEIDSAHVVAGGKLLLLTARVNDVSNLFSVPLDGSAALKNLSGTNRADQLLIWNPDHVTPGGRLVFSVLDLDSRVTSSYSVAADGSEARRALGRTGNSAGVAAVDGDDAYLVESLGEGNGFSLIRQGTGANAEPTVLASPQPPFDFQAASLQVIGDEVVYRVVDAVSGIGNVMSVHRDGRDRGAPKNLSGFAGPAEFTADTPVYAADSGRLVYAVRNRNRDGLPTANDVYSVHPSDPTSRLQLTVQQPDPLVDEIDRLEILGQAVVFRRGEGRWSVGRLSAAQSERRLEDLAPQLGSYREQGIVVDDLFADRRDRVVRCVAFRVTVGNPGNTITDFWSVRVAGDDVAVARLSETNLRDGNDPASLVATRRQGIRVVPTLAGRILAQRGNQIYSLDPMAERDEKLASSNTGAITAFRIGLRGEAPGTLLYVAGGQLFASSVATDASEPGAVVNLTRFTGGQQIDGIFALTSQRAVLAVRTGGTRALYSVSLAPAAEESPVDVSRPTDTEDRFYLAF